MRVVKERAGGIVGRVMLLDDDGEDVVLVTRFLGHLADSGYSPNTLCAYAYDLRRLATFLDERHLGFGDFGPATAMEFLGYLRRVPSRRQPAGAAGPGPPAYRRGGRRPVRADPVPLRRGRLVTGPEHYATAEQHAGTALFRLHPFAYEVYIRCD